MFKKDMEKLFTDKVAEYLNKGYTIHVGTMSGSQGEIAKVDVYNEKELIRIVLDRYSFYDSWDSSYALIVGRWNGRIEGAWNWDTIWNDKLEVIEKQTFIGVSRDYFVSEEEFAEIKEKRENRWKASFVPEVENLTDDDAKKIVLPFVRRQKGCKSAKIGEIDKIAKVLKDGVPHYRVYARGNVFWMN